jgi:hypothetical protein
MARRKPAKTDDSLLPAASAADAAVSTDPAASPETEAEATAILPEPPHGTGEATLPLLLAAPAPEAGTGAPHEPVAIAADDAAEAASTAATAPAAAADQPAPVEIAAEPTDEAGSGRDVLLFLNRFSRWPKIPVSRAAAIALAAGLGAVAGLAAGAGFTGRADDPDPVLALQESIRTLAVEVRALKASVNTSDDGAGLAALRERLDRSETAQAALTAEIGKLATSVAALPVSAETTGSVAPAAAPAVARGWVLWRVRDGRALVHGTGGYYEVVPGSRIPGLGVVRKITREDGGWVVTTDNGRIVSPRG